MQLPVPELTNADTGSFPQDPDEVAVWLAGLDPLDSDGDARELLRGLTHSNRLVNDVDRRRAALVHFLAPLRAVLERLMESAQGQPLPLTRDFARDTRLADSLLREEAAAFRLLLADSDPPQEADATRSMQALLRRAELAVNTYRRIPTEVWRDAHALFEFAESHELTADAPHVADGPAAQQLSDHYRLLLLLAIVDPQRYQARQLPLLIEWLRERTDRIAVSSGAQNTQRISQSNGLWLVDLQQGAAPARAGSVLISDAAQLRIIDIQALQADVKQHVDEMRATRACLLGADILERQTLSRLAQRLESNPLRREVRRHARRREARAVDSVFSHKYIAARLLYESARDTPSADSGDTGTERIEPLLTPRDNKSPGWVVVDHSAGGCQIQHPCAPPGSVQVGELVSLHDPVAHHASGTNNTRRDVLLGVVQRLNANDDGSLSVGISALARAIIPVVVSRDDESDAAPENGLIIASRTSTGAVQTILLPPFLYQSGERLVAKQSDRSIRIELTRCLQLNGLFSQYQLKPFSKS